MISTLLLLLVLRDEGSASSFKTKQSSPFIVFSPVQMEFVNKLAVDFGSRPCQHSKKQLILQNILTKLRQFQAVNNV